MAAQVKAAERTIYRDARFAEQVDAVAANVGKEFRQKVLSREARTTRQEIGLLARLGPQEQKAVAREVLEGGKTIRESLNEKRERERLKAYQRTADGEALIERADWSDWLPRQPQCDLLLTDPPYSTDVEDIRAFASEWLPRALDKVKPTGRAYVFVGAYPEELRAYLSVEHRWMKLLNVLVWTYRSAMGPQPKLTYKLNWQAILYWCGPEAPPLSCPNLKEQFAVHDVNPPEAHLGRRYHGWQKPDELAERFIVHSTRAGGVVLDPFAGTGTFLLAAARLGRCALGCEIDQEMFELARKRGCERAS